MGNKWTTFPEPSYPAFRFESSASQPKLFTVAGIAGILSMRRYENAVAKQRTLLAVKLEHHQKDIFFLMRKTGKMGKCFSKIKKTKKKN
jgi:hypothetical protein